MQSDAPPAEFLIAADLLGPSDLDCAWNREARPQQLPESSRGLVNLPLLHVLKPRVSRECCFQLVEGVDLVIDKREGRA